MSSLIESTNFPHGNNLLHCLAERDDINSTMKLLNVMDQHVRAEALAKKNFGGRSPLDFAKSFEFRNLMSWSDAQEGFYYLPTPPSVLIMYTTSSRESVEREKQDLIDAFPEFNVRVDIKADPDESEMLGAIRDTQNQHPDMSALIVIVMSHGVNGRLSARNGEVSMQDILLQMCSPSLEGKPKVYMLLYSLCKGRAHQYHSWM